MSCVCVCLCVCVCMCVLCKLGTQIEMQSVELTCACDNVCEWECLYHHQTGLFATCITGVCKYAVHECVCVCVWLCITKYAI